MGCTGTYDSNGNLTNVTISDEKKSEILSSDFTGSGTSTDPYQVNSSLGFWYMSKFVNLANKYVELNCDVVLNDETFDKDGNASGGDGVVYSWEPEIDYIIDQINGNKHCIFGLYVNDEQKNEAGLFPSLLEIKNTNIKNVFIKVKKFAYGFCFTAKKISNCKTFDGFIISVENTASGFSIYSDDILNCINDMNVVAYLNANGICDNAKNIISCKNYGDITTTKDSESIVTCSGIGRNISYLIDNCENYGNISGYEYIAGICGLVYIATTNLMINNCKNFGNISSVRYAGGIVGGGYQNKYLTIQNCESYGKVTGRGNLGGIIAYTLVNTMIANCVVDCEIERSVSWTARGAILGRAGIRGDGTQQNIDLQIFNSKIECEQTNYIIDHISNANVKISSCEINQEYHNNCSFINIFNRTDLKISNTSINLFNVTTDESYKLIYELQNNANLSIKNVLIQSDCVMTDFKLYGGTIGSCDVDGVIVVNGTTPYYYYGNDFSGFYISWRTDKFGLKRNDSSFFQSEVTKEKLIAMGATEKIS